MESLLELFVHVRDFCQAFLSNLEQHLFSSGALKRRRARSLSLSEVMTILVHLLNRITATSKPIKEQGRCQPQQIQANLFANEV